MAEEENKTEEETSTEETSETTEEETTEESEESTSEESTSKTDEIDYKALAEGEKRRADELQKKVANLAFKNRNKKREESNDDSGNEDEDKPLTRSEIADIIAQERVSIQKDVKQDKILGLLRSNTRSEDEAQAALQYYRTRIIPTGDDAEDALASIAVLNYRNLSAKSVQLAKAVRSKETARADSGSSVQEGTGSNPPQLSKADANELKNVGFVWDSNKRVFKKKLKTDKYLYYDARQKKRWVA